MSLSDPSSGVNMFKSAETSDLSSFQQHVGNRLTSPSTILHHLENQKMSLILINVWRFLQTRERISVVMQNKNIVLSARPRIEMMISWTPHNTITSFFYNKEWFDTSPFLWKIKIPESKQRWGPMNMSLSDPPSGLKVLNTWRPMTFCWISMRRRLDAPLWECGVEISFFDSQRFKSVQIENKNTGVYIVVVMFTVLLIRFFFGVVD